MDNEFKIGDKVEIVNYGHKIWLNKHDEFNTKNPPTKNIISEDDNKWWIDIKPDIIGKQGIITECRLNQNKKSYSVYPIGYPFYSNNLKLIT